MFETFTSRANPTAASHAAKTRIVMGMGKKVIELVFREDADVMMNRDNIIPSRHRSEDMRCERNIKVPRSDREKARVRLM